MYDDVYVSKTQIAPYLKLYQKLLTVMDNQ